MFNFFKKRDPKIQEDVINELSWDPSVESDQITVTSNDGIVTLSGTVPHYYEKFSAEEAAQRVGGVKSVKDELEVEMLESYERSDEDIAEAARNSLKWNYEVPDGVTVSVDDGWLTLRGVADRDYQRRAAKNAVCSLMGVCGVSNEMTLKSSVQPSDIKTRIEDALKRSAESEASNISVGVDGSRVTLSGNVGSYSEIEDARMAAWSAPGVLAVVNNLQLAA